MADTTFRTKEPTVKLFSSDGGYKCEGIGLGFIIKREQVDKGLQDAAEAAGLDLDTLRAIGLAVVGIDFQPPVSMESAAIFAFALTVETGASLEVRKVGDGEVLSRIPRPARA